SSDVCSSDPPLPKRDQTPPSPRKGKRRVAFALHEEFTLKNQRQTRPPDPVEPARGQSSDRKQELFDRRRERFDDRPVFRARFHRSYKVRFRGSEIEDPDQFLDVHLLRRQPSPKHVIARSHHLEPEPAQVSVQLPRGHEKSFAWSEL